MSLQNATAYARSPDRASTFRTQHRIWDLPYRWDYVTFFQAINLQYDVSLVLEHDTWHLRLFFFGLGSIARFISAYGMLHLPAHNNINYALRREHSADGTNAA